MHDLNEPEVVTFESGALTGELVFAQGRGS